MSTASSIVPDIDLSIIIPVYNESENIVQLLDEVRSILNQKKWSFEIIVIDDGSKDSTFSLVEKQCQLNSEIKLIQFRKNFGQTAAISAGFHYAAGQIIIPLDGDGQNDPASIPSLIEYLDQGYDVVSGWRKSRKDKTLSRKLPSILANLLISKTTGVRLHDYGCTLKAYKSEFVKNIRIYGEMHRFIPVYAAWEGARIGEIEVNHRARVHGKSNYGIDRTIKVFFDILVVKFIEKYYSKPIYIFGTVSLASIFLAVLMFILMIYFKVTGQKTFVQTPLPALVVTFGMVGVLSFLIGLLAEMVTRTYFESQKRFVFKIKNTANIKLIL